MREAEKECVSASARKRDRESQGGSEIVRVTFVFLSLICTHTVSPSPVYTRIDAQPHNYAQRSHTDVYTHIIYPLYLQHTVKRFAVAAIFWCNLNYD